MDLVQPLKYKQAEKLEKAASALAGFKGEGTFTSTAKGAAGQIRHLNEYSRNIAMGHENGRPFANYKPKRPTLAIGKVNMASNVQFAWDARISTRLRESIATPERMHCSDISRLIRYRHSSQRLVVRVIS